MNSLFFNDYRICPEHWILIGHMPPGHWILIGHMPLTLDSTWPNGNWILIGYFHVKSLDACTSLVGTLLRCGPSMYRVS